MGKEKTSNELFYIDPETGEKSDAALHDGILAEGKQSTETLEASVERLMAHGWSREDAERSVGLRKDD